MNRNTLLPILIAALAFLGGLGGMLGSKQVIAESDVAAVNEFGKSLIEPLAGIILAVVGAILAKVLHYNFISPSDVGKKDGNKPSGGGVPLLLLLGTMAVFMTGLSSCSSFSEIPITGSVTWRDPDSGAKAALTVGNKASRYAAPKVRAEK